MLLKKRCPNWDMENRFNFKTSVSEQELQAMQLLADKFSQDSRFNTWLRYQVYKFCKNEILPMAIDGSLPVCKTLIDKRYVISEIMINDSFTNIELLKMLANATCSTPTSIIQRNIIDPALRSSGIILL